jgi:hypothetical protein
MSSVGSAAGAGSQARDMDEPLCPICALRVISDCVCSPARHLGDREASRDERLARAERAARAGSPR